MGRSRCLGTPGRISTFAHLVPARSRSRFGAVGRRGTLLDRLREAVQASEPRTIDWDRRQKLQGEPLGAVVDDV